MEKVNNKEIIIYAVLGAVIFNSVLCSVIQFLAALALGGSNFAFAVRGIKLYWVFTLNSAVPLQIIVYLIPYLLAMVAIGGSLKALTKIAPGRTRFFTIAFAVLLAGFALFDVFYSAFSVLLKFNPHNDWVRIAELLNLSGTAGIIFIFFVIIFTAGYLNLMLKKILKYINI